MTIHYSDDQLELHHGDALDVLRTLPDGSVNSCVTSPPYFGLRDYGEPGQYGLEASPAEYVQTMRALFAEVRRVLADDGTLWLNLGDSYSGSWGNQGRKEERGTQRPINAPMIQPVHDGRYGDPKASGTGRVNPEQGDDHDAADPRGRNPGDVWTISTKPFAEAHFAVMPPELAERCILAGCKPGGTVLDPFSGSGTTGMVAQRHGRKYVGIDLNADYLDLSLRTRLQQASLDFSGGAA